ncbi:MAG: ABC transporter ATP-binding protein [Planctomycetia bacterium]|nr:ABC transporter ATP-binding protein [Planctomycetia bacterium]
MGEAILACRRHRAPGGSMPPARCRPAAIPVPIAPMNERGARDGTAATTDSGQPQAAETVSGGLLALGGRVRSAWNEYRDVVGWSFATIIRISPLLAWANIAVSIICGLTPVAMFLALRGIVNGRLTAEAGGGAAALTPWLVLLFATAVVEAVASLARQLLRNLLLDRANRDLTAAVMEQAVRQPVSFFDRHASLDMLESLRGEVASRLVNLIWNVLLSLTSVIQIVTIVACLIRIEPLIVVVAVPCFVPYLWYHLALSRGLFADHLRQIGTRRWMRYSLDLLTTATHAAEVRLLGLAPRLLGRFRETMTAFAESDARRLWREFYGSLFFALLSLVAFLGIFARVALSTLGRATAVGDVAFFAAAVIRLRNSLEMLTHTIAIGVSHTRHARALRAFLELPAGDGPMRGEGRPLPVPFRPEIRCEGVSFRYPGAKRLSLRDVSLEIRAGETVAIVGENGSGKTTLVKLLAGFYPPTEGRILVSGADIRDLPLEELRRKISFVFQDFGRYAASVAENIAYGDWPRMADDREAIERCARRADLVEDVARMPEGLDTMLGRQFGNYDPSGGVWQKIAIARAFAREAPLLILDEPTASIDARAEHELFDQLVALAEGRTTILISHRFSTVSMAQRIVVLEQGRVVEQGSHQELLAMNGQYAKLYGYHQRRFEG